MKTMIKSLFFGFACACAVSASAQVSVPSTFKHISIDGSFADWTGVPLAYTATEGSADAIQYENIYIANDQTNLYIRFTLYSPRPDAFANSYDNIFIDTDDSSASGYAVAGIGSEMLIQWGGGYQEKNGGFNEGGINGLGWTHSRVARQHGFRTVHLAGGDLCLGRHPGFCEQHHRPAAGRRQHFLCQHGLCPAVQAAYLLRWSST